MSDVRYLEFLGRLHQAVEPSTYLEIGVRHGDSLALARCPSIGIDPGFELRVDVGPEASLFRETSDEYFMRPDPMAPLGGRPADMAFIDGMHLAEFALRDFEAVERHSHWASVVVFDDILPRKPIEAARDRRTRAWTGDVFKILRVLDRIRPDLICLRVGTRPTGLLVVLGLDPESRVLKERYDEIVARTVVPDPQRVPAAVLQRRGVLEPEAVLGSSLWSFLRDARASGMEREEGVRELRRSVRRDLGLVSASRLVRRLPVLA